MLNPLMVRVTVALSLAAGTLALPATGAPVAAQQTNPDDPVQQEGNDILGDVRSQVDTLTSGSSGSGGRPAPTCEWEDDNGQVHEGRMRWRIARVDQETWGDINNEDIEQGTFYRYECWSDDMDCGDPQHEGDDGCYGDVTYDNWCGDIVCYFDAINPPNLARLAVEDNFLETLGPPEPRFNPPGGTTIVNFDTWMWVENVPGTGRQGPWVMDDVPGILVTAWASLDEVEWDMGDGHTEPCPITTDEASAERDCSYAYQQSSAGESGGEYHGTVSVLWQVEWEATIYGNDIENTIDAPRENDFSLAVAEGQAIVTDD